MAQNTGYLLSKAFVIGSAPEGSWLQQKRAQVHISDENDPGLAMLIRRLLNMNVSLFRHIRGYL